MLGAVHIPTIPRDGDLTASQLADNLPKSHFGDCFLGLFLAPRSEVGFPGKQTLKWGFAYRDSIGCITGNSMFGERGEQDRAEGKAELQ